MPELVTCSSCGEHVLAHACRCPHCDVQLRVCGPRPSTTAAAALLGLTLAGCPSGGSNNSDYAAGDTWDSARDTSDSDTDLTE